MYRKILVPIDGSDAAGSALVQATGFARIAGASMLLLHVVDALDRISGFEPPDASIDAIRPGLVAAGRALLAQAQAEVRAQGIEAQVLLVESQSAHVAPSIVEQAGAHEADLVVMGTHGLRGVRRLTIGSDAEQVARTSPVPVMLVRQRG